MASSPPEILSGIIYPSFTSAFTGVFNNPIPMYGILASATITPFALPSTGDTLASTVGIGPNFPGSTNPVIAFPLLPFPESFKFVPIGVVIVITSAPAIAAATFLQFSAAS